MSVTQFRPYRVRKIVPETEFFKIGSKFNREFADDDLAKSGLTLEDMYGFAAENLMIPQGATAGYLIPYFDLKGQIIYEKDQHAAMYRIKLRYPVYAKEKRYTQPSGEELQSHGLPSFVPYLYPLPEGIETETMYCCEGEKKTVSVVKHLGLPAFGISGCNLWGNPARTGGAHPWILDYLSSRKVKRVVIIPDGDIFRYDICTAYGTFAHALMQAGYEVELLNPPGKIDDLIAEGLRDLGTISRLKPEELVQSPVQLATTYDLAFKRVKDEKIIVHQHTSNIMRLIERHPAFPKIWRNLDNNRVFMGDMQAQPDLTEMEIANHIQHNFGLEKVTARVVYQCIQAISKKNQRSPFLDYIKSQVWDGKPRLDEWMINTWGVEDSAFTREVSAKWLISACARMAIPGSKVDWMLIVVGPQGTGKTSMPGILFKGNSLTLYGDNSDKDLHMLLHSALVVGFDELDSFTRKDSSNLKAMITRTEDFFRPPYGASVEVFPRRFTLYGCGNRHEFLQSDPSGQRRYPIIEVTRLLDFERLEAEKDQIWAEAWFRYSAGKEKWWEVEGATENAKKHEIPSLLEEQISAWIDAQFVSKHAAMVKDNELRFSMSQLIQGINQPMQTGSPVVREAAAFLRGMGVEQRVVWENKMTKRLYIVRR